MKIGITERGDAGMNLSWKEKIQKMDGAVLITKKLNSAFLDALMGTYATYKNIILHVTVTGWGGTLAEPGTHGYQEQLSQAAGLIRAGFPAANCVLRIDPIWPTPAGISRALDVIRLSRQMDGVKDIRRIRVSVLDEYAHVKRRLRAIGAQPVYGDRFYAPPRMMGDVRRSLESTGLTFECCAEKYLQGPRFIHRGCVSGADLQVFGLTAPAGMPMGMQGRSGCMCLSCKTEMLTKRHPCPINCIYCYWKRPGE